MDLVLGKTLKPSQLLHENSPELVPYLRSAVDMRRVDPIPVRWTRSSLAYVSQRASLVLAMNDFGLVVNHLTLDTAISGHLAELKLKSSVASADFLRFALLDCSRRQKIASDGKTNFKDVLEAIRAQRIEIPSSSKQDTDVELLKNVERSLIAQEKAVDSLRIAVAETFLNVLGKPEPTNPNFVELVPLGSIATFFRGQRIPAEEVGQAVGDGVRFLSDLIGDPISPSPQFIFPSKSNRLKQEILQPSDIVISRALRKLLLAIIWSKGQAESSFIDRFILIRTNPKLLNAAYFLGLLRSVYGGQLLSDVASGGSMPQLSKSGLERLLVPLPSMNLQKRFAETYQERVESYLEAVEQLQKKRFELDAALDEVFRT